MNDRKEDQHLKDYLKGGSDLSRHYRGESEEKPPAHVDAVILRAAQYAARKHRKPVTPLWYVPLSLAAVLVIGVSVLLSMHDYQGESVYSAAKIEQSFEGATAAKSAPSVAGERSAPVTPPETALQPDLQSAAQNAPDQQNTRSQLEEIVSRPAPATLQNATRQEKQMRMEAPQINTRAMEYRIREETPSRESAPQNAHMEYAPLSPPVADITTTVNDTPGTVAVQKANADNRASAAPPAASISATNRAVQGAVLEEKTVTGGIAADNRLAQIKQLWLADRKDDALESFKEFLADFPDYPRVAIIKQLPADFDVDKYLNKDSNAE